MSDYEVYDVSMDNMYDRERKKIREGYKNNPIIKTVGHLRYRLEDLPDDLLLDVGCQCDSFSEWDLQLVNKGACLEVCLTMTPGAELI